MTLITTAANAQQPSATTATPPPAVQARDRRGIGASSGTPSSSMEQMADDAITFIKAKACKQVDLLGFSMGGIEAGKAFLARLQERAQNRDTEISASALFAQLEALRTWGLKAPADLSVVKHPVLVANGGADRMMPTPNTHDLARRLPNSTLVIYPDSGHGATFQFHADVVPKALEFLAR